MPSETSFAFDPDTDGDVDAGYEPDIDPESGRQAGNRRQSQAGPEGYARAGDDDAGADQQIELRVLYGPQAGSRLALAEGEYLLGTSDQCTIILTGPNIEEEHAILTIEGDGISIQPLDGDVTDAQGNDFPDSMALDLGQAVELGGIWIAVDRLDAAWPDVQSIAPPPGSMPAPSPRSLDGDDWDGDGDDGHADGGAGEQDDAGSPGADGGDGVEGQGAAAAALLETVDADAGDDPAAPEPAGVRASVAEEEVPFAKPRKSTRLPAALALVAIGLAALLAVIWFAVDDDEEQTGVVSATVGKTRRAAEAARALTQPRPVVPAAITSYLKTLPGGDQLTVVRDDTGDWRVNGHVRTHAERRQLVDGLAGLTPTATAQVTVDEDLAAAANRFLAARPVNTGNTVMLRTEALGGGALRLTGAAVDAAAVEAATREIMASVPGVRRVESQVALSQQLREQLRSRIAAAGLDKRLTYVQEAPEVVLSGKLNADETRRWEALLLQFSRDYGNIVPIRASIANAVVASAGAGNGGGAGPQRLPIGVQAIVSGPVPYIVTNRGERVNQGGEIDGQTLVSVRDGEVVFEGKRRVRIMR